MPRIGNKGRWVHVLAVGFVLAVSGCAPQNTTFQPNAPNASRSTMAADVQRVVSSTYNAKTTTVTLHVRNTDVRNPMKTLVSGPGNVENAVDLNNKDGLANYATSLYPDKVVRYVQITSDENRNQKGALTTSATTTQYVVTNHGWVNYHSQPSASSPILGRLQMGERAPLVHKFNSYWYEISWNHQNVYITTNSQYTHILSDASAPPGTTTATAMPTTVTVPSEISHPATPPAQAPAPGLRPSTGQTSSIKLPPTGVTMDNSITPRAGLSASVVAKTNAVLSVAQSKLGTPYIWGHNEDRGQAGFDCSNFTEYVFHHALGYKFTTSSRGQYSSVGVTVPVSQIRAGDLMIFNQGGHCGIYAGNNQIIQEGGGLAKVGYLKFTPGSYWYTHLSAVRRMY